MHLIFEDLCFVPINQTVRAMLGGLPHAREHVFPSPRKKGRLVDASRRPNVPLPWTGKDMPWRVAALPTLREPFD